VTTPIAEISRSGSPRWDVGRPPGSVIAIRDVRVRRLVPAISAVTAVIFGPAVGLVVVDTLWPGATGWSLGDRLELFFAIAVPVAILDFFLTQVYLRWIARISSFDVRRWSIAPTTVLLERMDGRTVEIPRAHLAVSEAPVADRWFRVTYPSGEMALAFYVPGPVADLLRSSARPGS
jgi:hypothetical protein